MCTAAFLVFKICCGLVLFIGFQSGIYSQQCLTLNDFEPYGVEQLDDMTMINATDDTQLWFMGNVCNVYVDCDFSYDPGEFLVYYSYKENGAFSMDRCVRAQQRGDYYVFELPLGVRQIRMDTGVFSSIVVSFEEIQINRYTFNTVMRFSTENLFYLLIVPGMLYSVLDLIFAAKRENGREQKKVEGKA